MNNRWVLGTILGQAVITLAAIAYGMSAHASWEQERQRRIAGERAAVTEMATAMKGAGDRLITVERELERCQVRLRRTARRTADVPAASATTAETPRTVAPTELSREEAFPVDAGPITWARGGIWCEGRYEVVHGNNFAPCRTRP